MIKFRNNKTITYIECFDNSESQIRNSKINIKNKEMLEYYEDCLFIHPSIAQILKIENIEKFDISDYDSYQVEISDLYDEM